MYQNYKTPVPHFGPFTSQEEGEVQCCCCRTALPWYFLVLFNYVFSLSATVTNLLVILAILKTPSLHTPSNVLLCSLALSDLAIGLGVQSLFAFSLSTGLEMRAYLNVASLFLVGASFLTMTAISIDRYLALFLHMKYRAIVTVRRVLLITSFLWVFSLMGNSLRYLISFKANNLIIVSFIFLCLLTSSYCYFQIYRIVRRHRRQIRDQEPSFTSGGVPTPRQGKSIKTMYYIHGLFVLCIVPYPIGIGFYIHLGPRPDTMLLMCCVMSILFFNSSINPYLYCWRMLEIRRAITTLLRYWRTRFVRICTFDIISS